MTLLKVVLKRGRSKPLWVGHPWIYSGAVQSVEGTVPDTGGPCLVEDERGNVLGAGFYNPHARIAVRLHQHRRTTDDAFSPRTLESVLAERIHAAAERRVGFGLPGPVTDAYRVVNSEGDGLPGLVVDRFGSAVVGHLNARATYEARAAIGRVLVAKLKPTRVDLVVTDEASERETIPAGSETVYGEGTDGQVEIHEHGVRYMVGLERGQKTGFYLDQRENRARFAALSVGKRVLDLYSYVGAFGLAALAAGAASAESIDSSPRAIETATQNADRNHLSSRYSATQADVMTYLKEMQASGRSWDRVVCNPPKLARGRASLDDALQKYARVNTLALSVLAPGGMLLTCSCSEHVSTDEFLRMLTDSGHRLRRGVCVHAVWGQATDHPWSAVAPEGSYLKCALVSLA